MSDLENYDSFYEQLSANLEQMRSLAKLKLELERLNVATYLDVPSWTPWFGNASGLGDSQEADIDGACDAVLDYAAKVLSDDHAALSAMEANLEAAHLALNGGEVGGTHFEGIAPAVRQINVGLASWTSETAGVFVTNYVDSIDARQGNQTRTIERSRSAVQTGMEILVRAREKALDLPVYATIALLAYDPVADALISGMEVAFVVISLATNPVGGLLISVASKSLTAQSGLSVAGLMRELENAVKRSEEAKLECEEAVAERLQEYLDEEASDWSGHVCSRPYPGDLTVIPPQL